MSSFDQLEEDRALRDAARAVFREELSYVRGELSPQAIGERIADNIGRKADAATDKAAELAEDHGAAVAATLGSAAAAAGLWFARGPIATGLAALFGKKENHQGDSDSGGITDIEDSEDE